MLPWYHPHSLFLTDAKKSAAHSPLTPVYVQVCLAARKVGFNIKRAAEPFSTGTPLSGTIFVYSSCSSAISHLLNFNSDYARKTSSLSRGESSNF
jgi:hypothetical protein